MRGLYAVALFAASWPLRPLGQTIDGDVVGTVFDVTGAAVPNAASN